MQLMQNASHLGLLSFLLCLSTVAGYLRRGDASSLALLAGQKQVDVSDSQGRTLQELSQVAQDLTADEDADNSDLRDLQGQIVALGQKRAAKKRDAARKASEIAFVQSEIAKIKNKERLRAGEATESEASQAVMAASSSSSVATAAASSGSVASAAQQQAAVSERSASDAMSETKIEAEADAALASAEDAEHQNANQATHQQAVEVAHASEVATNSASSSNSRAQAQVAEAAKEETSVASSRAATKTVAVEAVAQQKASSSASASTQQSSVTDAEKLELERLRKEEALHKQQEAEQLKQEEDARKQQEELADSADDSFKEYMKEEDGEDQQGDADYEDSANALAGAIGWNRKEVESKADEGIKQLTQAIGGKKVVQSLQGMMAGIR